MLVLLLKEIRSFFSSLIAYIVIIVFLIINGLFLWVFPGQFNILEAGYANLDSLFFLAPWIFLFLVPAITMRLFSEERRLGTIELLLTKPLSDIQLVIAKYFAGVILVILSLLPTLIYYITVYLLGNPPGNLDAGGFWGSYIGLFFLAAVYTAIGLYASSLTENQIISLIIAILISFFFYIGFDSISLLNLPKGIDNFIIQLGINDHYKSISRGVVDTRDIIYFLTVIILFILLTKLKLESRKWK
ncbi:MAG: gliding motility-associated ABC transporter permease subunit GldF [Marinilabiliales bacterium]